MANLAFTLNGVIMKHSTEVKNNLLFKRISVKCSDTDEIHDLLSALSSWGKITDSVSNIQVILNVDDDPYTKRFIALDDYGICLNLKIYDDVVPVQFKSIAVNIKSKTVKDVDGSKFKKKFLEANLVLEKQSLDGDKRFDDLYLKHTEPDEETGKDVIVPLPIEFSQIERFSLFGEPEQVTPEDDDESDVAMPQVYQTV